MYYKCHKVNFRRDGSYIDSPDWVKKDKTAINPKKKDDKCFQYQEIVTLNHEEINRHQQRVSNVRSLINKYNCKGINYPSKIDDWKTFEKNSPTIAFPTIAFNIL